MRLRGLLCAAMALALAAPAEAAIVHRDLVYDLGSPPAEPRFNALDLYLPEGTQQDASLPVVVYVHGGAWRAGDKSNQIADKVRLFTGAGYAFASVNYRLSPADPTVLDPGRSRFPDHPHDIGEAIGWLKSHVGDHGADPGRMLLIGHSAGAHLVSLVSTDPAYTGAYGIEPWRLIGTVSLDTDAFDIASEADPLSPTANNPVLFQNAFGTPAENAAAGPWQAASPIAWADPGDPEFLFVTSQLPRRVADNQAMATALGQGPAAVLSLPYDHEQINDAVGGGADPAGETQAILSFLAARVAEARAPAKPRLWDRPPRRIETSWRKVGVRLRFGAARAASFECRLDRQHYRACESPRVFRVGQGAHRLRVRGRSDSGRPGPATTCRFRVVPLSG
jgi:acetyl esterase/lipase